MALFEDAQRAGINLWSFGKNLLSTRGEELHGFYGSASWLSIGVATLQLCSEVHCLNGVYGNEIEDLLGSSDTSLSIKHLDKKMPLVSENLHGLSQSINLLSIESIERWDWMVAQQDGWETQENEGKDRWPGPQTLRMIFPFFSN